MLAARKLAAAPQAAKDQPQGDHARAGWRWTRQILLAVAAGISLPSCLTYGLWSWASEPTHPGHVVGVVQEEGTRALVYSRDGSDVDGSYVAMAIPTGLVEEDLIVLASTGRGDALAIQSRAIQPCSSVPPDGEPRIVETARFIDYRQTVGTVELPEGHPRVGLVQLLGEDDELLHEVYVYDEELSAWVRVGTMEVGEERPSSGRIMAAVVLSPVAVAADALTVLVLMMAEYNGPYPVAWTSREARGTGPVTLHQRDAYWESLGQGESQPGTRIPARPPIAGDWVFELRTDR